MRYVLLATLFLVQDDEAARKAKNHSKEKRDLIVWMKMEGGYNQQVTEDNKKYPYLAVYGDRTVICRRGTGKYYKGELKEEQMLELLTGLVKEGFLDLRPPEGIPNVAETVRETIGIKIDYQSNEIKIPGNLDNLLSSRPNDERLKKIKKIRDQLYNYYVPGHKECDPAKEFDGRNK